MTIITKGMGAILKAVKKRKTLTISGSPKPKKREFIIKKKSKPSKTKLADTWQDRRIEAINRKIKNYKGSKAYIAPDYAQEATDIYGSKASTKKSYKADQKKFYSLPEEQRNKIWKIKARRELKGK